MHIIFVANYGTAPRSFAIGRAHFLMLAMVLLCAVLGVGFSVHALISAFSESPQIDRVVTPNASATLNMMAQKLGEMEAQLLRIDTFSDRLSKMIGPRAPGANDYRPSPKAKPDQSSKLRQDKDVASIQGHLTQVSMAIEERSKRLDHLETLVVEDRVKWQALPTTPPIRDGYHSSDYGARVDPFDGHASFHAGIDFVAPIGTRFSSAAAGIVVSVHRLADYGNVIEVDHGNGIKTVYAHASKILVSVGDLVLKGQVIGEVGSTGRSTGPHLHFEVRENGQTINPQTFLRLES